MKLYIGAKFARKGEVLEAYEKARNEGHQITADWTKHKSISPYWKNPEIAKDYAEEDLKGVMECDAFIVLGGEAEISGGLSVELGAAMALHEKTGKPLVYVVGSLENKTMFVHHGAVKIKGSFGEVLGEIKGK